MGSISNKCASNIGYIIQCDLVSKGARVGKKVRWQQEGIYDVDVQEVAEYAQ